MVKRQNTKIVKSDKDVVVKKIQLLSNYSGMRFFILEEKDAVLVLKCLKRCVLVNALLMKKRKENLIFDPKEHKQTERLIKEMENK